MNPNEYNVKIGLTSEAETLKDAVEDLQDLVSEQEKRIALLERKINPFKYFISIIKEKLFTKKEEEVD